MKVKILSVDFNLKGTGIINKSFWDAPSFSDYDVIIIDPEQISEYWTTRIESEGDGSLWSYTQSDRGYGNILNELFNRRANEIEQLLTITGGILICILRQKGNILQLAPSLYHKSDRLTLSRYSWLPSSKLYPYTFFCPVGRIGESIKLINKKHPFSQFFSVLKEDIYHEAVITGERIRIAKPIASDKVGGLIGCEVPFGKGKIIFLPPLKRIDQAKVGGILIDCIKKSLQWTEPLKKPAWLTKYSLPNEERIKDEISRLKEEMERIERLIEEQEKDFKSLEMIKGLLYEQGKYGLEPAVREAFRIIGFAVPEPEEYEEEYDLFIKEGDMIIIGEVEGSTKQVGVTKYRQLLDYTDVRLTKGERVKGILIGNGLLGSDPEEREEQFTDEAIRGCESKKFCRMTTFELFKAVRAVFDNPERRDEIKRAIISCESEFKFD